MPCAKWQAKKGNWHAKKYLNGQTKEKIASQNVLGLLKQVLMALNFFSPFHALKTLFIRNIVYPGSISIKHK